VQAWIREDEEEASTVITIALHCKRGSGCTEEESESEDESDEGSEKSEVICKRGEGHEDEYITFLARFGPAMAGVAEWNKNKDNVALSELLTVTDEAFIHLCIINYSKTWKAQEKGKNSEGEYVEEVPVSEIN
jgi:hypothetical protein